MTQNKHVNLLLEVLGCFVSAAGIYSFAVASGVPVTGVAGVCAILYRLFGIPMGLSNVLINIPVILFSYKVLGKSFLLRSMRCMVLFAVFTDYLLPMIPVYTGDRLLATLCGGVICGIGDALIYMQNSSTGGIDFITMAVKVKHPHLPFGNITFAAALAVIVANGLVFHDVDSIIYGLIFNFVCSAVINKMMFGFSSSMLAMIVTDDGECRAAATFAQVEQQLKTQENFLVCNRGLLLNMDKVLRFEGDCIEMLDGARLPVRLKDKNSLFAQFTQYQFRHMQREF